MKSLMQAYLPPAALTLMGMLVWVTWLQCSPTTQTQHQPDGTETSQEPIREAEFIETETETKPPVNPNLGQGWWHDGRYIRDEQGRSIVLRGWNLSSSHKQSATFGHTNKDDYLRIGTWGFNVLRFVMNWSLLEPKRGEYNQDYLNGILQRLDWAKEAGLFVVLDMHQDVYGPGFQGNGTPLWTCAEDNYKKFTPKNPWYMGYLTREVQTCFDGLYKTPENRKAYAAAWKKIVEITHQHPAVVGFDLMNEPFWGTTDPGTFHHEVLQPFYEESIRAIREITQKHLIFIEPIAFIALGDLYGRFKPFADKKLVYAAHFYLPSMHDQGMYSGKSEEINTPLQRLYEEAQALKIPLWIGEYGGPTQSKDFSSYMNDVEQRLAQWATGSAYWSYDRGGFAPFDQQGKIIQEPFQAIQRAYPRAVAGKIMSWSSSPTAKTFQLSWQEDGTRSQETVIFLPPHHFGEAPQVTSTDPAGTWSHTWNSSSRLLTVVANPSVSQHTITIQP